MSLYLDPSAILPRLVQEPASAVIRARLIVARQDRWISDFAAAEVASGLSRLVRMQRLDGAACRRRAARPAYVRRFDLMLRAPDALHLAICRRLNATLVSLDRRLAHAAHQLGIAVAMPGEASGDGK